MTFTTDRDLLALEPAVFRDVPFVSQQRLHVTDATLAGVTLTSAAADFAAAQVNTGSVVLVNGTPLEVLARSDAHTLTVSLPRTSLGDDATPPGDGTGLDLVARTFAPQAALVHDALLALLGVDDDGAIVSLSVMARLEALGTLERVFASALAITGDQVALAQKAADYRHRFGAACRAAVVLLDLDRDGVADTRRRLGVVALTRV